MDKKHPVSEKKLKKAFENGQIPNAPLVRALLITGVIGFAIEFVMPLIFVNTQNLLKFQEVTNEARWESTTVILGYSAAFITLAGLFSSLTSHLLCKGEFSLGSKLKFQAPSLSNYLTGVLNSIKELPQWLIRGVILVALCVLALRLFMIGSRADFALRYSFYALTGGLLIMSIVQYGFARFRFLKELMMTDKEVIDEMKEEEGDPHRRSYRLSMHRELSLEERVKRAKVILVDYGDVRHS